MAQTPTPIATHLERALRGDFTPQLARRLDEAGLDVECPLPRQLRVPEIARWLEVIREEVYPGLSRGEGLRSLGQRALDGIGRGFTEQAALTMLRWVGPQRALRQAESRLARTPLDLTVREVGRREAVLHVGDAQGMPEMFQGLLEAFAPRVGAKGATVDFEAEGPRGASFHVLWR